MTTIVCPTDKRLQDVISINIKEAKEEVSTYKALAPCSTNIALYEKVKNVYSIDKSLTKLKLEAKFPTQKGVNSLDKLLGVKYFDIIQKDILNDVYGADNGKLKTMDDIINYDFVGKIPQPHIPCKFLGNNCGKYNDGNGPTSVTCCDKGVLTEMRCNINPNTKTLGIKDHRERPIPDDCLVAESDPKSKFDIYRAIAKKAKEEVAAGKCLATSTVKSSKTNAVLKPAELTAKQCYMAHWADVTKGLANTKQFVQKRTTQDMDYFDEYYKCPVMDVDNKSQRFCNNIYNFSEDPRKEFILDTKGDMVMEPVTILGETIDTSCDINPFCTVKNWKLNAAGKYERGTDLASEVIQKPKMRANKNTPKQFRKADLSAAVYDNVSSTANYLNILFNPTIGVGSNYMVSTHKCLDKNGQEQYVQAPIYSSSNGNQPLVDLKNNLNVAIYDSLFINKVVKLNDVRELVAKPEILKKMLQTPYKSDFTLTIRKVEYKFKMNDDIKHNINGILKGGQSGLVYSLIDDIKSIEPVASLNSFLGQSSNVTMKCDEIAKKVPSFPLSQYLVKASSNDRNGNVNTTTVKTTPIILKNCYVKEGFSKKSSYFIEIMLVIALILILLKYC